MTSYRKSSQAIEIRLKLHAIVVCNIFFAHDASMANTVRPTLSESGIARTYVVVFKTQNSIENHSNKTEIREGDVRQILICKF